MSVATQTGSTTKRKAATRPKKRLGSAFDRWIGKVTVEDRKARELEWFAHTMRDGYQCSCWRIEPITDDPDNPDAWSVAPYDVVQRGASFVGRYRCPKCGLEWECGYSVDYVLNGPWGVA
jgi:hypothetical protein